MSSKGNPKLQARRKIALENLQDRLIASRAGALKLVRATGPRAKVGVPYTEGDTARMEAEIATLTQRVGPARSLSENQTGRIRNARHRDHVPGSR